TAPNHQSPKTGQSAAAWPAAPGPVRPTVAWTSRAPDRRDQAHSARFAETGATCRQKPPEYARSKCSRSSWANTLKKGYQVYIGYKCSLNATVRSLSTP